MITCKFFRIFYEADNVRWSSSENFFILIKIQKTQKIQVCLITVLKYETFFSMNFLEILYITRIAF